MPKTYTVTYSYTVSVAVGLCEGPITGLGRVWDLDPVGHRRRAVVEGGAGHGAGGQHDDVERDPVPAEAPAERHRQREREHRHDGGESDDAARLDEVHRRLQDALADSHQ